MIYEMRVYDIAPGKMAANEKRFEKANVPALFEKHGMKVVGFWTTMIGENAGNRLVYILGYKSLAHRQECWSSWKTDTTWPNIKKESDPEGNMIAGITSSILVPSKYSPLQ